MPPETPPHGARSTSQPDMPDRLWVRRDESALGPFEVLSVDDPAGRAEIEPGWHEYVKAPERCRLSPGCQWPAGHEGEHPCGRRVRPGDPCTSCGAPEPCERCWRPATVADLKSIAAEAGRSVDVVDGVGEVVPEEARSSCVLCGQPSPTSLCDGCHRAQNPPPEQYCVVCMKPLGDDQREFPDGCMAHERCFVDAPYDEIESHMKRQRRGDS